ncbi:hypothetical protein [Rufibacter roseolus]|uniref:hypothetical protein n=1 Tax=Rufibacter roseolus TaxID=2817375 RepID=UPI001B31119C|nr:hypothetical protein [Rufibacter roseolus]
MTKLLFVIFFMALTFNSFSSSCSLPDEENWLPVVQKYIQESETIFLGEVIGSKDKSTIIKVLDVFKGEVSTDTIYLSADIDYEPLGYVKKWPMGVAIFYTKQASVNSYKEVLINKSCGMSRSITDLPTFRPLELQISEKSEMFSENELLQREAEAYMRIQPLLLKNWINEYALLNAYRNSHQKVEEPQFSKSDYLSYLAVALLMVAVLVAFFRKQR